MGRIGHSAVGKAGEMNVRLITVGWNAVENDRTHELEDGHFHHTLVKVRRLVLDHLDSDDLVRLHILTFHHLPESPLPKDVEDEIPRRTCCQHRRGRMKQTNSLVTFICP